MTVSLEEINSTQKRIKITIAVEQVDTAFNKAYTNLKKKAKIQGFRQGKAPLNMIKKLYGGSVASQGGSLRAERVGRRSRERADEAVPATIRTGCRSLFRGGTAGQPQRTTLVAGCVGLARRRGQTTDGMW